MRCCSDLQCGKLSLQTLNMGRMLRRVSDAGTVRAPSCSLSLSTCFAQSRVLLKQPIPLLKYETQFSITSR